MRSLVLAAQFSLETSCDTKDMSFVWTYVVLVSYTPPLYWKCIDHLYSVLVSFATREARRTDSRVMLYRTDEDCCS